MRHRFNPAAAAAFGVTLVVLGIVGWSAGWLAAGSDRLDQGRGLPSASAEPTREAKPSPTASQKPSPSPSPEATSTIRADAFPMPDFVGMKFREARAVAIDKKLSVEVRFGQSGPAGTVVSTDPEADIYVYPGLAIFLFVAGDAPTFLLPDLSGKACADAKAQLLNSGLKIKGYPMGQKGTARKTEPAAGTLVTWNTQVNLFCQ